MKYIKTHCWVQNAQAQRKAKVKMNTTADTNVEGNIFDTANNAHNAENHLQN
jgi:hypothetical protein